MLLRAFGSTHYFIFIAIKNNSISSCCVQPCGSTRCRGHWLVSEYYNVQSANAIKTTGHNSRFRSSGSWLRLTLLPSVCGFH